MYTVIGSDGKQYGPVGTDDLLQWVRDGRIVLGTVLIEHGSGRRLMASDVPEIVALLAPPPGFGVAGGYTPRPMVRVGPDGRPLKNKVAAGVLGICLGPFGVHRFYPGYNSVGIAMVLITVLTCGYGAIATGIWGLVEGIMCFTGSMQDAEGRPLSDQARTNHAAEEIPVDLPTVPDRERCRRIRMLRVWQYPVATRRSPACRRTAAAASA